MKVGRIVFCACVLLSFSACSTEPGETTAKGAIAGGALGAGLGAIIGSTTGDAGGGLVIGAVAGAGTGAAIGNAFEAQEKIIRTQDEAMTRQGRQIAEQQSQIEELRRMGQDQIAYDNQNDGYGSTYKSLDNALGQQNNNSYSYRQNTYNDNNGYGNIGNNLNNNYNGSNYNVTNPMIGSNDLSRTTQEVNRQQNNIQQNNLINNNSVPYGNNRVNETVNTVKQEIIVPNYNDNNLRVGNNTEAKGAYNWNKHDSDVVGNARVDSLAIVVPEADDNNCEEAEKEARNAREASTLNDRLLYYRRALKLCPNNSNFHNSLGEVYLSLNRNKDAEAEFEEALKLNTKNAAAFTNLKSLRRVNSKKY